jgi:hypothetical protein
MKLTGLKKKPSLFNNYQGLVSVVLNIQSELTDEIKFKNSAFIKTGRKIPTGLYSADKFLFYKGDIYRLTFNKAKSLINDIIDEYTQEQILKGFRWNNCIVWLTSENQQNYASWVSSAKSDSSLLPFQAKFTDSKTGEDVCYEFSDIKELEDFYGKSIKFINNVLRESRNLKKEFSDNEDLYKEAFEKLKG